MTTDEFIKLVAQMRDAQIRYFGATNGSQAKYDALSESKKLEKEVDKRLENRAKYGKFSDPQQSMF